MNYPKAHRVNRQFNYIPAEQTDIGARFERERLRMQADATRGTKIERF